MLTHHYLYLSEYHGCKVLCFSVVVFSVFLAHPKAQGELL